MWMCRNCGKKFEKYDKYYVKAKGLLRHVAAGKYVEVKQCPYCGSRNIVEVENSERGHNKNNA